MKILFLLFCHLVFLTTFIVVCGYELDNEENAYDPSQGISQTLNVGVYGNNQSGEVTETKSTRGQEKGISIDNHGYVLYCPCMGRFGNQAEQLLGSLAFAKGLNRTLVLPPWIAYTHDKPGTSIRVKLNKWLKVKPIMKYHKVLTMENFMENLASSVWPVGKRIGFCYTFRGGDKCGMKDGNPFGPFWDHFDVDFDGYEEHVGILWDSYVPSIQQKWKERYPASKFPVMAFQGAPGEFPSLPEHHSIQKYLKFSKYISNKADDFIRDILKKKRFVAIHLRNGADMIQVCQDVEQFDTLFASAQCQGQFPRKKLTTEMCAPSRSAILKKAKQLVSEIGARAVFVGTDNDPMLNELEGIFGDEKVTVHIRSPEDEVEDPIVELAIMTKSDLFIGNCVSTFSAFVRRHRDVHKQRSEFFGTS